MDLEKDVSALQTGCPDENSKIRKIQLPAINRRKGCFVIRIEINTISTKIKPWPRLTPNTSLIN
jgi:hypothetical protein